MWLRRDYTDVLVIGAPTFRHLQYNIGWLHRAWPERVLGYSLLGIVLDEGGYRKIEGLIVRDWVLMGQNEWRDRIEGALERSRLAYYRV